MTVRKDELSAAFESFVALAKRLGFLYTEALTVYEEQKIYWLLLRNRDGTFSESAFPRILGTSKASAAHALRAYAGALSAVVQLQAGLLEQAKRKKG